MLHVTKLLTRLTRYIWAAPCSIVGLALALPMTLVGARYKKVFGVLEVALSQQDKPGAYLLQKLPFCAITFGHVVIGLSEHHLECLRAHEHEHVRQYERWGLLFFLAYPASSLYQWVRGNNAYWNNWFEVQARLSADQAKYRA
ncbi:MAG: hypothetical protein ACYCZJ_02890 [Sulfuriferula sp.]